MKNMHKLKEFKYLLNIYIFFLPVHVIIVTVYLKMCRLLFILFFFSLLVSFFLSNFNEHPNYKEKLDLSYKLNEI